MTGANVFVVPTLTALRRLRKLRSGRQHRPSEQPNSRHWTCLHRQSIREAKARRWTFGVWQWLESRYLELEDPAEYFDGDADVGDLPDALVDDAETEEATKAKMKELDRLAEFGA